MHLHNRSMKFTAQVVFISPCNLPFGGGLQGERLLVLVMVMVLVLVMVLVHRFA